MNSDSTGSAPEVERSSPELESEGRLDGTARFWLVLACFFLSGFAALIYQTAWTRQFAFVFGTSELAVATVLAAYMGGLASGAAIAGRFAPRVSRPVLVYGLLELGIALAALAVPFGVRLAQWVYLAAFGSAGEPPGEGGLLTALFYLACSFAILFPATALMGATLPLLTRYAVRSDRQIGSRIGALYSANTVGAVVGTAIAGFVLLPSLGLSATVWTAVAGNALVFAVAALLARNPGPTPPQATAHAALEGRSSWILVLIAFSGSVSFLYEVLWTRMLGQILGGSVYAFATMLSTFLAGIALGSWVASRLASNRQRSVIGFAWAQVGTAVLALGAFELVDQLPAIARSMQVGALVGDALLSALVLLPSTLFIGATFPFAVRIYARDESDATAASARVYSWNTLGSIVGAVGAGFFLVPALGYAGSLSIGVAINLALATAAVTLIRPPNRAIVAASCAALLALVLFRPDPPWTLLSSSPFTRQPADGELIYFSVGRSSTVQLRERSGVYQLLTNGLQESMIEPPGASFVYSRLAPWMAGLPVLARPDTKSMLIVGLGGGGVAEAAPDSLERIDVVELEPKVVEANRRAAALRANDPLADPRVRITINDARGSLLLTQRRYDAIVSQPSHPWTAGASHLYTREFFELAKNRLSDDGILVQWMGLGFVDEALLKVLLASMIDVFDHVSLYAPIRGGVLLVASPRPFDTYGAAARALAQAPLGFAPLGVFSPEDVETALVLDAAGTRALAAGSPISTDDYNLLQTRSPAIARRQKLGLNVEELMPRADPLLRPDPRRSDVRAVRSLLRKGFAARARRLTDSIEDPRARALAEALLSANTGKSRRLFKRALELDPDSDEARLGLVNSYPTELKRGEAEVIELVRQLRDPAAAIAEGWRIQAQLGRSAEASAQLRKLDARLAQCQPSEAFFASALRLRAAWRLESSEPEHWHQALSLLDRFGTIFGSFDDQLMRARAAVASGSYRGALAIIARLDPTFRRHPQRRQRARMALKILEDIPREELSSTSQALMGRLRVAALGRRAGSGQRPRVAR